MCGVRGYTILGQESIPFLIPPYTEYSTDITDVTDCTLDWLQPSLFPLFKGRERNEKCCASGFRFFFRFLKFPWLSGLRGCVTCKHYVTPLCKIPNCFSPLYNRKKLMKYPSVFCYYLWKGCTIRRPIVCLFSLKLWEKYHFRPISCMFWHEKEAHYNHCLRQFLCSSDYIFSS